jgi:hypothetical protein
VKPKNAYFEAWYKFTNYMNRGNAYAQAGLINTRGFEVCLSGLHTYLRVIEMDSEVMDEAMARGA